MNQSKTQRVSIELYNPEKTEYIEITIKQFSTVGLSATADMVFSEITNALHKIIKKHTELIES